MSTMAAIATNIKTTNPNKTNKMSVDLLQHKNTNNIVTPNTKQILLLANSHTDVANKTM